MISRKKRKFFFNLFGIATVSFWLVMIGLLVKEINFKGHAEGIDYGHAVTAIDSAQREWKEIYLKEEKVGYAVSLIKPFEKGYFLQEEIFLKLNLMGIGSGVYTLTQSLVDDKFLLKSFNFKMTSGVISFDISGRIEGSQLLIETGKGKERRTQRIELSRSPMISVGMGHFFKYRKIRVGETFKLPLFDPSTMAQKDIFVRVIAREPVTINKIRYDAFRLETEMWGKLITLWLDENGTTLKEEGFMGLTTIKSSPARAPFDLEGQGGIDLYEMTAINVDKELNDPDRLGYLKLKVDGISYMSIDTGAWNDRRQRFHDGIIEITKKKLPLKSSYNLLHDGYDDEIRTFLEPEFNIESDEEEMIKRARQISGDEKNPLFISMKLLNWVYSSLEKRPVVSVPSAMEVLRTRVGDCNEHATLLTALLRASGIPARLSIGLVYTRGKFYYHAWTEAYLGEWVSMDATLNQMPVDVTHIKLLSGNLDKQVEIAGLIGELKLEVIDYRYD